MLTESKIKEKLIDKISNTDDDELLSQISRLIDLESQIESIYHLNPEQHHAIKEGLDQLDNGQFMTTDQVKTEK